jgi:hypothetical protein
MRWAGNLSCTEEIRYTYKILVGKPETKRPLGRSGRRWKNNIGMDLGETVRKRGMNSFGSG